MLFSFVFLLAILDCLINSPKFIQKSRYYLILLLTIFTILYPYPILYIVVEVCLILVLVENSYLDHKRRLKEQEEELAAAAAAAAVSGKDENVLPKSAHEYLKKSYEEFLINVTNVKTNHLNQPWNVLNSSEGVTISQSDYPGQKFKFWKVECEVSGEIENIKKEIMEYDQRCKWDSALQSGRILKTFSKIDIGEPYLTIFYTNPAAGGAVASREVIDFGLYIENPPSFIGFDYINCTVPKHMKFKEIPTKVTGERGTTQTGSGIRVQAIEGQPGKFKYIMVNALDLSGWLPVSLINSATSGALSGGARAMIAQLEKTAKKEQ
jgi:hypothetical protein